LIGIIYLHGNGDKCSMTVLSFYYHPNDSIWR